VYLMNRRSTGRRLRFEERVASQTRVEDDSQDPVHALAAADRVRRALRGVPTDQRDALVMHHVYGWSFAEISARLGIRINAAKTRAFRGMRKMREQLK